MSSRTITLTSRPPVTITEEDWPEIASAKWHDGKVECEAIRSKWIKVRQHTDGRILVYGGYSSTYANARDLRGGELLIPIKQKIDGSRIVAAINRVAVTVRCEEIAQECVADLPAEVI